MPKHVMDKNSRIFVAGHRGLVGSGITRNLQEQGFKNLILKTRQELDLLNQKAVSEFFQKNEIDFVFLAAARVGGILANSRAPADFLYENVMVAANVIHAAAQNNTKKLLFLGSSCIYPRMAPQPMKESSLLSGPLEPTNEGYALGKIVGLKLCEMYFKQYGHHFISAMPTNLYGPGDNFHPENSHVIPGMLRRFHVAKMKNEPQVVCWGSGNVKREFLYVDDLSEALTKLMQEYDQPETINVGTGSDCTIRELAELIKEVVGFKGAIVYDTTKPDGPARKLLDVTRMDEFGWHAQVGLKAGLTKTYKWVLDNQVFDK